MGTNDDTTTTETAASYHRIAGALWAGLDAQGVHFMIGEAPGGEVTVIRREDVPALVRALADAGYASVTDEVQRVSVEALRLVGDRLTAIETRQQSNYDYLRERLNRTDDVASKSSVAFNNALAAERDKHIEEERRIMDRVDAAIEQIRQRIEGDDGSVAQIAQLTILLDGLQTQVEQHQTLLAQVKPGPTTAAIDAASAAWVDRAIDAALDGVARKEWVDTSLHRLSQTLREHIASVATEILEHTAAGPGVFTRARRALAVLLDAGPREAPRVTSPRNGHSPQAASVAGARAARGVVP